MSSPCQLFYIVEVLFQPFEGKNTQLIIVIIYGKLNTYVVRSRDYLTQRSPISILADSYSW